MFVIECIRLLIGSNPVHGDLALAMTLVMTLLKKTTAEHEWFKTNTKYEKSLGRETNKKKTLLASDSITGLNKE